MAEMYNMKQKSVKVSVKVSLLIPGKSMVKREPNSIFFLSYHYRVMSGERHSPVAFFPTKYRFVPAELEADLAPVLVLKI
jgi:hypothetical protein